MVLSERKKAVPKTREKNERRMRNFLFIRKETLRCPCRSIGFFLGWCGSGSFWSGDDGGGFDWSCFSHGFFRCGSVPLQRLLSIGVDVLLNIGEGRIDGKCLRFCFSGFGEAIVVAYAERKYDGSNGDKSQKEGE